MAAFDFGVPFQRAVLRLCMVDEAFAHKAMEYLECDHFTTELLGWVFKTMQRYWQMYSRRCTETPLREALRYEANAPSYLTEIEAIVQLGHVAEADYIKHELQEFCRRQVFAVAHREAARYYNDNQLDKAYDTMGRAQDRMHEIRFDDIDRQWYFEELSERYQKRQRDSFASERETFRTGIDPLDDITGGVQPGELWVVFAYAKRCKTTWLVNMGWLATYVDCAPTVHFVLEGKGSQTAARYDARFSRDLYADIKAGRMSATTYQWMQDEFVRRRGLLVIRTLNDWDVNVLHLQAELNELKARGFKPEMSVLDYMDLGRSRTRVESETQHQVNFARDYKRLLLQNDMAGWSAWQAQRPKDGAHDKEHVLTSSNVADAYAKVRIVDAYGSLNATDEEMRRGEMRVFFESHRDSPVNQVYRITNDLARMRMITSWARMDNSPTAVLPAPSEFADA
jgi:replicative DNA helicase